MYVIGYLEQEDKVLYLDKNLQLRNRNNGVSPLSFDDKLEAVSFFKQNISNVALANTFHGKDRSKIVTINTKKNAKYYPIYTDWYDVTKSIESISVLVNELLLRQNNALVLDLEFYKDVNEKRRIRQLAGLMLGKNVKYVNKYIYNPSKMSDVTQFRMLRDLNITYKEACLLTIESAMSDLQKFIENNRITTIVSWQNSMDLHIVEQEGYTEILHGLEFIDAYKVFAKYGTKDVSMSLKSICTLLNLKEEGIWHDALNDAQMLNKLCCLYMYVLKDHEKWPSMRNITKPNFQDPGDRVNDNQLNLFDL